MIRLHVQVVVAGAAVLALEIVAGRLMVPAFGTSLFIWGAVLSVTLLCLAIGYRWGGRLADRVERPARRLVGHLVLAAIWIAATATLGDRLLVLGLSAGHALGPIVVACGLFAAPLTLLATATPLAIGARLAAGGSRPASISGDLLALGTAGSIGGALVAAYLAVPLLGVGRSLEVIAAALLVVALPDILAGRFLRRATLLLLALAALRALPGEWRGAPVLHPGVEFLHRTSSRYGQIDVLVDHRDGSRILLHGGASQNHVGGPDWSVSYFEYIPRALEAAGDGPGRALVLGLGAGTLVRGLDRQGHDVEAVELDGEVIAVAREFFAFPDRLPVHRADARAFLAGADTVYDLIVLDLAGGGTHPDHVYTREALLAMRRLLADDGALIVNLVVHVAGPDARVLAHFAATVAGIFRRVDVLTLEPDRDRRGQLGQVLVFASPTARPTFLRRDELGDRVAFDPTLRPLTDDWNPMPLWSGAASAEWHANIREWLGDGAVASIER